MAAFARSDILRIVFVQQPLCTEGRAACAASPRRHLQCPALRPSEADVVVMLKWIWGVSDPKIKKKKGGGREISQPAAESLPIDQLQEVSAQLSTA